MKRIWKYYVEIIESQRIPLPVGATILSVQSQGNDICLWALVEPTNSKEFRTFCVYGTGHTLPNADALKHLATVQTHQGMMVWHVFEQP